MEKEQFRELFRQLLKDCGYTTRSGYGFKYISDDYAVGIALEHSSYDKDYYVEYGAVFQPGIIRKNILYQFDWYKQFRFTANESLDLKDYPIEDFGCYYPNQIVQYFNYEFGTEESFRYQFAENEKRCVRRIENKEFVLDIFRTNWVRYRMISYERVRKVAKLCGFDPEEVIRIRDSNMNGKQIEEYLKNRK